MSTIYTADTHVAEPIESFPDLENNTKNADTPLETTKLFEKENKTNIDIDELQLTPIAPERKLVNAEVNIATDSDSRRLVQYQYWDKAFDTQNPCKDSAQHNLPGFCRMDYITWDYTCSDGYKKLSGVLLPCWCGGSYTNKDFIDIDINSLVKCHPQNCNGSSCDANVTYKSYDELKKDEEAAKAQDRKDQEGEEIIHYNENVRKNPDYKKYNRALSPVTDDVASIGPM
jgi:hypothetical protein